MDVGCSSRAARREVSPDRWVEPGRYLDLDVLEELDVFDAGSEIEDSEEQDSEDDGAADISGSHLM